MQQLQWRSWRCEADSLCLERERETWGMLFVLRWEFRAISVLLGRTRGRCSFHTLGLNSHCVFVSLGPSHLANSDMGVRR